MKRLLLLIFAFLPFYLFSTHLLGGHLKYEYLSLSSNGCAQYKISFVKYLNCDASSNYQFPNAPSQDAIIGIYEHDQFSNPNGGGIKSLIKTANLVYDSALTTLVNIPVPSNCINSTSKCVFTATYEGIVELCYNDPLNNGALTPSQKGYHIVVERCCRNASVVNLNVPGSQGIAIHCYIPPDMVPNNSPNINIDSIWVGCVNDTSQLSYHVSDLDGDSVVVSITPPLKGANSGTGNPMPQPSNVLTWPIPTGIYSGGYSSSLPFGNGSVVDLISNQQVLNLYSAIQGDFSIGLKLFEYRNNNLIGIYNREIQMAFLNCSPPNNTPPNLDPNQGISANQTVFSIIEGDTLDFDFGLSDTQNDSVFMNYNGLIFDSNHITPPAFISTLSQQNPANTLHNFYWESPVNASFNSPFDFKLYVTDSYCDNNLRIIPFIINVSSNNTFIENKINKVKIHPNPTCDVVQITGIDRIIKVEIYDYNGKFLLSTDRSVIDLSDCPSGIYLLKVFYGNKTQELRIIKE